MNTNYHLTKTSGINKTLTDHNHTVKPQITDRRMMSTNYLKETPSREPFNVDPDLVKILEKNQDIINQLEPIFILHPSVKDDNGTNTQLNFSLLHIISFCQLYKFRRFPQSERLYSQEFSKVLKAKYGSSSEYLKQRLGFDLQAAPGANLRFDQNGHRINFFTFDEGLKDGRDFRVLKNEWPYAIPRDYQHLVVWSRLPLLNPALCKSTIDWNMAMGTGLSGFVNLSTDLTSKLRQFNLKVKEPQAVELENRPRLDREIIKFIKNRWKEEEGYFDLIWILNPVQLQSCPDLPHFHVFIKKKNH